MAGNDLRLKGAGLCKSCHYEGSSSAESAVET